MENTRALSHVSYHVIDQPLDRAALVNIDVVLVGLHILAHADLRRLGILGYSVLGLTDDAEEFAMKTGRGTKLLCPDPILEYEEWVTFMEQLGPLCQKRPALIPTSDPYVLALDRAADRLKGYYRFHGFGSGLHTKLTSKRSTFALADKYGFPGPRTWFVGNKQELDACLQPIDRPMIIKPEFSPDWRTDTAMRKIGHAKVLTAKDTRELVAAYDTVIDLSPNVMVQEDIPGPDRDLIYFAAFVGSDHTVRGRLVGRKIRVTPVHYGSASFVQLVDMEEVESQCAEFLHAIGYHGRCGMEVKIDARDGVAKLIEVNPRPGIWENLGIPAGVDLAGEDVASHFGTEPPPRRVNRVNVCWIHVGRDIRAFRQYRAERSLGAWEWLRSLRPPLVVTDLPVIADPPFALSNLRVLFRGTMHYLRRRLRRRPR